jgi:protoporphyrinogen oxidase
MKIGVIGAGPAGLTAAYKLQQAGFDVTLIESTPKVGGMCRSFELWNQIVDIGPHRFFSSDDLVNDFWFEMAGKDYKLVERLTRIYYNKKFFYYPLKPFNALFNLGIFQGIICFMSYIWAKLTTQELSHFEGWVSNRFGHRLYSIFFKTYSEKLWGIECSELDSKFAKQRIKNFSLFEALKSFVTSNRGKHKTLVEEFAFPLKGTGQIYETISSQFQTAGGELLLECKVLSINVEANGVELKTEKDTFKFDKIISTMPLTIFVENINITPEKVKVASRKLKFRNTRLAYLKVEGSNHFKDQWIYVHDKKLKTGRITNFRNWVSDINLGQSESIICLEYWCNEDEELWSLSDENFLELAQKEIKHTGLIYGEILDSKSIRVPRCYPIYTMDHETHLKVLQNYLDGVDNLTVIGRYGSFKYNNQDHSILMGLLVADNMINGKSHNLWDLNNDSNYQERAISK